MIKYKKIVFCRVIFITFANSKNDMKKVLTFTHQHEITNMK